MFCRFCGEEIQKNWNYCPSCGGDISMSKDWDKEISNLIESDFKDRNIFYNKVLNILQRNGGFIIFTNPETDKFIQFASDEFDDINYLLCNIPPKEFNPNQPSISKILEKIYYFNENNISGDFLDLKCNLDEAVEIINLFFLDVCDLNKDYQVKLKYNIRNKS